MGTPCPAQGRTWRGHRVARAVRNLRCLVVLVAIASIVGAVSPVPSAAQQGATVDAGVLNVRAEPGTWSPVVGQAVFGQAVSLLAGPTPDGWYQIVANGAVGWVHGWYLLLGGTLGWAPPAEPALTTDAATWSPPESSQALDATPADAAPAVGGAAGLGAPLTAGYEAGGGAPPRGLERWIDVDRTTQTVTLYEGGAPVAGYWGAMGVDRSDAGFFATAVGTYYVYEKYADLSWTTWGQSWVRNWIGFDPNRLNGFHSYAMDWAGSVLPDGAGPTGGCVALDPWAAEQLFAFVQLGTRVEVHW